MARGTASTAKIHRAWLRKLPSAIGKSLTAVAKEINISPSTLTRPLKEGDDGTSTLHANTIQKVVDRFGIAPPADVTAAPLSGRRELQGFGEEAQPYQSRSGDPVEAALRALGAGRTVAPWTLGTRALEFAGYMPGDVVLVDLANASPQPGDAVCAQVYDWQNNRTETIMRVFERASGVNLLVAKTADMTIRQPHVVDGEKVVIKGVLLPHRLRP